MSERASLHEFTVGYLFCGSGLGALGHDVASVTVGGHAMRWRNLGGVDFDAEACEDFRTLTGAPALCADVAAMKPEQLRAFWGPRAPHLTKWSPPCKGASQLLPAEVAASPKYQAMNRLTLEATRLVLAAYSEPDNRPALVVVENVPSFQTRCRSTLAETIRLLRTAGYEVDMRTHDLGREGGLAQERQRFTLAARDPRRCPVPVELPPQRRLRGVGEVLGPLAWPDDPRAGRMHRLPRIEWLNAVRLALVPPGGDWRDLPKRGEVVRWLESRGLWPTGVDTQALRELVEEQLGNPVQAGQARREVHRRHPVQAWAAPSPTVSGPGGAGLSAVEDRRILEGLSPSERHGTGTAKRNGLLGVGDWREPAHTVIAAASISRAQGNGAVADPRLLAGLAMGADNPGRHTSKYAVQDWSAAGRTVTGAQQMGSGGPAVADARPLEGLGLGATAANADSYAGRPGLFGVGAWSEPSRTVVGRATVSSGNAQAALADERIEQLGLGCKCRSGVYGVLEWGTPSYTVTGSLQLDCGTGSVADPRLPPPRPVVDIRLALQLLAEGWEVPRGALAPAIISPLSGCWHRPLTTLELAVLQGLPAMLGEGTPLALAGNSDKRWRERIGNGIPVAGAEAWGRSMGEALLRGAMGEGWRLCGGGQWVAPQEGLEAGHA